jgi:hypothetical protein
LEQPYPDFYDYSNLTPTFLKRGNNMTNTPPATNHVKAGPVSFIIIGFIILCVICLGFSLVINLGQKAGILPTTVPTSTEDGSISAIQTIAVQTALAGIVKPSETKAPAVIPPTNTPVPLPVDTETPIPAPSIAMGTIGQRIEHNGIALTVTKVSKINSINTYLVPEAGNTYLVVEVIIENASRAEETPYNPFYFSVKDADGYQYTSAMLSPEPSLSAGKLVQGDKVRGNIAFEVKDTATGFVLSYEPLVIFGGYTPIRISLTK